MPEKVSFSGGIFTQNLLVHAPLDRFTLSPESWD